MADTLERDDLPASRSLQRRRRPAATALRSRGRPVTVPSRDSYRGLLPSRRAAWASVWVLLPGNPATLAGPGDGPGSHSPARVRDARLLRTSPCIPWRRLARVPGGSWGVRGL